MCEREGRPCVSDSAAGAGWSATLGWCRRRSCTQSRAASNRRSCIRIVYVVHLPLAGRDAPCTLAFAHGTPTMIQTSELTSSIHTNRGRSDGTKGQRERSAPNTTNFNEPYTYIPLCWCHSLYYLSRCVLCRWCVGWYRYCVCVSLCTMTLNAQRNKQREREEEERERKQKTGM